MYFILRNTLFCQSSGKLNVYVLFLCAERVDGFYACKCHTFQYNAWSHWSVTNVIKKLPGYPGLHPSKHNQTILRYFHRCIIKVRWFKGQVCNHTLVLQPKWKSYLNNDFLILARFSNWKIQTVRLMCIYYLRKYWN